MVVCCCSFRQTVKYLGTVASDWPVAQYVPDPDELPLD